MYDDAMRVADPALLTSDKLVSNRYDQYGDVLALRFPHDASRAALVFDGAGFITSPNSDFLVEPSTPQVSIHRCKDFRLGRHDHTRWPQLYTHSHPHLACIPRLPKAPGHAYFKDLVMWIKFERCVHLSQSESYLFVGDIGVINADLRARLGESVERLRARLELPEVSARVRVPGVDREYIRFRMGIIRTAMSRICDTPCTPATLARGLVEIQQAWLETTAWIDFYFVLGPNVKVGVVTSLSRVLGTICSNSLDLRAFMLAGIPVYHLRAASDFTDQRISEVIDLETPDQWAICLDLIDSAAPPIFKGPADSSERYLSLERESRSLFEFSKPFPTIGENHQMELGKSLVPAGRGQLRFAPYAAPSTSNVPVAEKPGRKRGTRGSKVKKGRGKYASKNAPEGTSGEPSDLPDRSLTRSAIIPQRNPEHRVRDPWSELTDHPLNAAAPPSIPAWKGVLQKIDRGSQASNRLRTTHSTKWVYFLPPPGLFFGVDTQERQNQYLQIWRFARPAMVCRIFSRRSITKIVETDGYDIALSNPTWKAFLGQGLLPVFLDNRQTDRAAEFVKLRRMFTNWLPKECLGECIPKECPPMTPHLARITIWDLCEYEFRMELVALDEAVTPPPPNLKTESELAEFRFARQSLIVDCLPGKWNGLISVVRENARSGLADPVWVERLPYLRAFWKVMDDWVTLTEKPYSWRRLADGASVSTELGLEWEKALVLYYAQTFFDYFGRPPILLRTLAPSDIDAPL